MQTNITLADTKFINKNHVPFKQYNSERLYPLGYTFILQRGKQSAQEYVIVDYAITHNASGEVVQFRYITEHKFLGQTIRAEQVQTTIDIATSNGWQRLKDKEVK